MAKVNLDFLEPEVATTLARRELADFDINDNTSYAKFLPSQEVPDIEYAIDVDTADRITAANWRMFNGTTTSEVWGQGEKARGRLMPLSRNFILDEESRLRMRNNADQLMEREAANLVRRAARSIALQVNLQRANAIYNGRIDLNGSGGLRQTVDFGRKEEFTNTAAKLFTDPSADPIQHLQDQVELYEDENGFRPELMHMTTRIRSLIANHPTVRAAIYGSDRAGESRARVNAADLNSYLADCDLPEIFITGTSKVKVDDLDNGGASKLVYLAPQDSITFTPASGDPANPESSVFGRTFWGQTMSANLPEFSPASSGLDLEGIVAAIIEHGWPAQQEVIADAIAMPVVFNPNYTLRTKVIEGPKDSAAAAGNTAGANTGANTGASAGASAGTEG